MSNVLPTLNDHIRKLARREVRAQTRATKRATSQYRRDIAALKRLVRALGAKVAHLEKHSKTGHGVVLSTGEASGSNRFRADGLRSHRARLGLSAKDFGRLVDVSGLTVYNWEAGKSRPRKKQLGALIGIRGIGKREAERRLSGDRAKQLA